MSERVQPEPVEHDPQETGRKTIAFFSGTPGGKFRYEKWLMWRGVANAARENGLNLIYFAGGDFGDSPHAVLYEMVDRHNVDGLILWHPFVGPLASYESMQQFVRQFQPLPAVSVELPLEGIASILLDNHQAVQDLLSHLVEEHGYQRIAYFYDHRSITACKRRDAFEQVMCDYGLFDPDLVGTLNELDQKGLQPGRDYQAVLAFTDDYAVSTIKALERRGLSVPDDVAVTGFNDGYEARGSLPPLTSVRIPFRRMGRTAVEMLVQQIQGGAAETTNNKLIPLKFVSRRSCGCLEPMAEAAAVGVHLVEDNNPGQFLRADRDELIENLAGYMGAPVENQGLLWAEDFLDVFTAELELHASGEGEDKPSRTFLEGLSDLLHQAVAEGSNVSRWHEALNTLRRQTLLHLDPCLRSFAEDIWQQARVLVGQSAMRSEINRSWHAAQRMETLRALQASMLIAADEKTLFEVIVDNLPDLGIGGLYLIQFEDGSQRDGWARMKLAYQEGSVVDLSDAERFPINQILPPRWLNETAPYSFLIESLHLRDEQFGYLVFITDPPLDPSECDVFHVLRTQISSALKGVSLRMELHDAWRQAEEANALKSTFLSMVSHELRTPLNLIVGLSEMALRQQPTRPQVGYDSLHDYLEQIHISGQHLDRLIRDVLDLASSQVGQMKLTSSPLDLVPLIHDVSRMACQLAEQKKLDFRLEIPPSLPLVMGDKTRLRQVMLNLLSNAIKFTARGEVVLTAETNERNQIVISVRDTGIGIPEYEQEKIFDEFSQSNRSVGRGYGGIGLGLAITRLLVEAHQGEIWVTSNGDHEAGSVFGFSLPVLRTQDLAVAEPVVVQNDTVLILTREIVNASDLESFLVGKGFQVKPVDLKQHDGKILADIRKSPPGAIVLDMNPAIELGWEIMQELKENPSTQDIPVLFYSLLMDQDAGAVVDVDYLTKPVGGEQLVKALKRFGLGTPRRVVQTILVIDDEPGILEFHSRLIQAELPNSQVLIARDGKQGLELMREYLPDLVVLDLMMPVMTGFEVLECMQMEQMLQNIPVIILSGQTLTDMDMSRLNQGVTAVLGKGMFSRQEVLERINQTLSHSRRLGTEAQRLVHQAMSFMHENYDQPISRGDIADLLCINEQYLSRCFSRELGLGPMSYLRRYRIKQAKSLLEKGNHTITQIALAVGFSSQSYFSRLFQKEVGVTPSAYQRGKRPSME